MRHPCQEAARRVSTWALNAKKGVLLGTPLPRNRQNPVSLLTLFYFLLNVLDSASLSKGRTAFLTFCPSGIKEYSTRGGLSAKDCLDTMLYLSSSRSLSDKVFWVMPSMRLIKSLNLKLPKLPMVNYAKGPFSAKENGCLLQRSRAVAIPFHPTLISYCA